MKFLYMDEKYADKSAKKETQVTYLAGLIVDPISHRECCEKYYEIVWDFVKEKPNVVPLTPVLHASKLPTNKTDQEHFMLFERVVQLILDQRLKILRVGLLNPVNYLKVFKGNEKYLLSLLMHRIYEYLQDEYEGTQIWPVMEVDRSDIQDQIMAGSLSTMNFINSTNLASTSINSEHFGDFLYCSKRSPYSFMIDTTIYLMHARYRRDLGETLSPYKIKLAKIADKLVEAFELDCITDLKPGDKEGSFVEIPI